jgi:hypothetical protein
MQRNIRVNIYSRENAFAEVPETWQTQEFVKRKPPSVNPFAAFVPRSSDSVRPLQRHISKAENALGGWIRALERSARRNSSSEQVTEKFSKKKSKFSNNGNGTQNLQHLRVCTFIRNSVD